MKKSKINTDVTNLTELEKVSLRKTRGQIPEFEPIYMLDAQAKNPFNILVEHEPEFELLFWFHLKERKESDEIEIIEA